MPIWFLPNNDISVALVNIFFDRAYRSTIMQSAGYAIEFAVSVLVKYFQKVGICK